MKLIQLPVQELEQRLSREIEENPALETGKENEEDTYEESEDYNDENIGFTPLTNSMRATSISVGDSLGP